MTKIQAYDQSSPAYKVAEKYKLTDHEHDVYLAVVMAGSDGIKLDKVGRHQLWTKMKDTSKGIKSPDIENALHKLVGEDLLQKDSQDVYTANFTTTANTGETKMAALTTKAELLKALAELKIPVKNNKMMKKDIKKALAALTKKAKAELKK